MRGRATTKQRSIVAAPFVALLLLVGCNAISGVDDLIVAPTVDSALATGDAANDPDGDRDRDGGNVIPLPEEDASDAGDVVDAEEPVDATVEDAQPPPPKRVFVTSTMTNANFGGLDGADQRCNTIAENAGLGGAWLAWLSTPEVDAIDRLLHTGAYVLLDGTVVVKSKQQLASGSIEHAIDMMEDKTSLTKNRGVWTGTRGNGTADATCNGWTSSSSSVLGTLASAVVTDVGWTKGAPQSGHADNWECNTIVSLYCFER